MKKKDINYRSRFRALNQLDRQIGRLIDSLSEYNLYDPTHVLYTSDNGFMLGEHNVFGKQQPYEECIRIPFYHKEPYGHQSSIKNQLIGTVDITPTLLDIAQVENKEQFDGKTFRKCKNRKWIYSEMFESGQSNKPDWFLLRSKEAVFIEKKNIGFEYYDLITDPKQNENLYHEGEFQGLESLLSKAKLCNGDCL